MKVLVVNCGSSSLKYQVLDMANESLLAKGLVERIGIKGSILTHEKEGADKHILETPMQNHKDAIGHVLDVIVDPNVGVLNNMNELGAVGHRVVHAGEYFSTSVKINDDVMKVLEECVDLAPLHNPPNILGIRACQELMPDTPMVAVFDTAYHQTMPEKSYIYAIPYEFYEKYKVRRYGFHGTSHRYVSSQAAKLMGKDIKDLKIISCHLGNGASVAAIKNGECIDTSMGFTPLEGLVMGTRSGDIDPAIIMYIKKKEDIKVAEVIDILNKKSGVLGISGVSSDFRDIENAAKGGNARAQLALDVFTWQVKKYIGRHLAELNGADAIIFTAGLGENGIDARADICSDLENLGVILDLERNNVRGKDTLISTEDSPIKIFVIPTNEELVIARDTVEVITGK